MARHRNDWLKEWRKTKRNITVAVSLVFEHHHFTVEWADNQKNSCVGKPRAVTSAAIVTVFPIPVGKPLSVRWTFICEKTPKGVLPFQCSISGSTITSSVDPVFIRNISASVPSMMRVRLASAFLGFKSVMMNDEPAELTVAASSASLDALFSCSLIFPHVGLRQQIHNKYSS